MDYGHWYYAGVPLNTDDWIGFVYKIEHTKSGMKYIGKKNFRSLRRKKIKNRKNRKHIHTESNWRTYTGSSKALNAAINANGKEEYKFTILSLHKTKGELSYAETKAIIMEDALIREDYYNISIQGIRKVGK